MSLILMIQIDYSQVLPQIRRMELDKRENIETLKKAEEENQNVNKYLPIAESLQSIITDKERQSALSKIIHYFERIKQTNDYVISQIKPNAEAFESLIELCKQRVDQDLAEGWPLEEITRNRAIKDTRSKKLIELEKREIVKAREQERYEIDQVKKLMAIGYSEERAVELATLPLPELLCSYLEELRQEHGLSLQE